MRHSGLNALILLVLGAAIGAGLELGATRLIARSPHDGPRATPVICDNTGGERCYQGGQHVKRPYVDDECWVDPNGGQGYVWARLSDVGPTASIFVCQPTV